MHIVTISNGGFETIIHDESEKLHSGKVVQGINTIDSLTFSMFPNNEGFGLINEFTTLVNVYNTNKRKYEFSGRVLYPETTMDDNGLITKEVTCESVFGFLCDSIQTYVDPKNWTVMELFQHLIDCHNSQVEEYKHFKIGEVTVTDPNDNLYIGIQRENTWAAINSKLIGKLGGEVRYRVEADGIYIDYLEQIGETRTTEIALSVNMKSITREQNPTDYVTRLIPLGCKLKKVDPSTGQAVETEQRLDISTVNNGSIYIDDEDAIKVYGIHVGVVTYDDITQASTLLRRGQQWMAANNKVQVKYSITALELALIGLAIDDLEVYNYHPIKNALLGIDDVARIIKKTIDVCNDTQSTIEVGDNFKTLSDIQREQAEQLASTLQNIQTIQTTTNNLQTNVNNAQTSLETLTGRVDEISGMHLYIRYSENADGSNMTVEPTERTVYIGTCTSDSAIAPTDPSEYDWVRLVFDSIEGVGVADIEAQFYMSTSDTELVGGEWTSEAPSWVENMYLWLRSLITYTDGQTSYTTPYCDSSWAAANDVAKELDNTSVELHEVIVQNSTELTNTCNEIILKALESYSETLGYEEFKRTVEAQLALLSDEVTIKFTETLSQLANVNGDLQSKFNQITKFFTFDIDGLTIGQIDNPYKVVLDNDRYSMQINGVEVLWIDAITQEVHTPEITITHRFRMMGYLIEEDTNGNINCEYVGESDTAK